MEMSNLYVLEVYDGFNGDRETGCMIFTEDDVNKINTDYEEWLCKAKKEGITDTFWNGDDKAYVMTIEEYKNVDSFIYYLNVHKGIDTFGISWEGAYFKKITMYKEKEK